MSIWDLFSSPLQCEEPKEAEEEPKQEEEEAAEQGEEAQEEEESSGGGDDEEEEEEEEAEDPAPAIEEDCAHSKGCAAALHHFEECQERIQEGHTKFGKNEDCVEEFFHLRHCVDTCAAGKIFAQLK